MERVTCKFENNIAIVQLNRPDKCNAVDMAMFKSLASVIKQLKNDRSVRAIVISGNGKDFCSGLDVKSVMKDPLAGIKLLWKWLPGSANLAQQVSFGWRKLSVPVITSIHGRCWGAGMQIALGADFRIASPKSSLAIMEAKWGLIPDMAGTLALTETLSVDQAMKMAMTAETLNGDEALKLGLVTELSDTPHERALALAQQLAESSRDCNKFIKKLYHKAWHKNDRRILLKETGYQWRTIFGRARKEHLAKIKP